MSLTTITGRPAARASPMLAMSVARRLISAGLPAPSQIDHVELAAQLGQAVQRDLQQPRLAGRVGQRVDVAVGLAEQHDLAAGRRPA